MISEVFFEFPLPAPHEGVPLGNGRDGILVHGSGNCLQFTLSRADLWDHRSASRQKHTPVWRELLTLLQSKDPEKKEKELAEKYAKECSENGIPPTPTLVPVGSFSLEFPPGFKLLAATLFLQSGTLRIFGKKGTVPFEMEVDLTADGRLVIQFKQTLKYHLKLFPSFYQVKEMKEYSYPAPEMFESGESRGWIQRIPGEKPIAVRIQQSGRKISVRMIRDLCFPEESPEKNAIRERRLFWKKWMKNIPEITIPDKQVELLYTFGMYKFKSYSDSRYGIPGTLQGPWIEDHRFPPWSSDYHFNINVQMCYSPAFASGCFEELRVLFDKILSWKPLLSENAKRLIGISNGYLLPRASDDHGKSVWCPWTGFVDYGSSAWIANMMFQYVEYSGDSDFLKNSAFDFLRGIFETGYALLSWKQEGYCEFPLSVSPEYEFQWMSYGKNSSFQLAAMHRLCRDLTDAAAMLNLPVDPRWKAVENALPLFSDYRERPDSPPEDGLIGLWDGAVLNQSHRHHSHLAGIVPFDTLDLSEFKMRRIVDNSLRHLTAYGFGKWSGWSFPWAAQIHSHVGNGNMSGMFLKIAAECFFTHGMASLHDARFPGLSIFSPTVPVDSHLTPELMKNEVMQTDAGFGFVAALLDMAVHVRNRILYLGEGIPDSWKNASFRGIQTPFGVKVDYRIQNGEIHSATLYAFRKTEFLLKEPGKNSRILPVKMDAGEKHCLVFGKKQK